MPIVGGRDDILSCVERYKIDKIIVAVPSATAEEKRDILNICKETGCELKNLPGVYQFLTGEVKVSALRDVDVEELLGREPIKVNMEEIHAFIHGKKGDGDRRRRKHWIRTLSSDRIVSTETVDRV